MRLTAQLDNVNHEISFVRDGERLIANVDDRSYDLAIHSSNNGLYLFTRDGDVFECLVEKDDARKDTFRLHLKNHNYVATVIDPRRLSSTHGSSVTASASSAEITSPMAGKVVRVLIAQGSKVNAGDGVVVVEAMKMQNELRAPRDGVVSEILIVEGATVDAGQVLAIIEATKN